MCIRDRGRVHYYEGYTMSDVVLPTRLMGMLGAKKLILTNAAGGANFDFKPGDFMIINDHITIAIPSPLIGENIDELGVRFPDMSEVYSLRMRNIIRDTAKQMEIKMQEGVYMQFTGPAYETPAEVRLARMLGGDAVGMSTACEAMAAHHMGMEVCGISCITNPVSYTHLDVYKRQGLQRCCLDCSVHFLTYIQDLMLL